MDLAEVGAGHRALNPYLAPPAHQTHVAPHLQRQLIIPSRPRPEAHDLHEKIVRHLLALEAVRTRELAPLHHILVQLEDLRRDPLLRLDRNDVVAAHDLLAVAQTVVQADLDDGRGRVQEDAEQDAGAAPVLQDAAVPVQLALVFVHDLDCDLLLGVRRDDTVQRGVGHLWFDEIRCLF